mmetsp:Transcript_3607/g.10456  ORF Transcript_3607/g.10456 Transcript_3607/m.10456 type:complete len:330 (+) Transcript_3607:169-1158(+)
MDEDIVEKGWPRRALCRWLAYVVLWTTTVVVCAVSAFHMSLAVAGALLGCLLASSLPLLFATLFEGTYARRSRRDMPYVFCPIMGAGVVLLGSLVLLQASSMIVSMLSTANVKDAREFCKLFGHVPQEQMPHTICIDHAFVKTDWEAGKLRCEDLHGHVQCLPAFVAAPIFNSKREGSVGLADEIWGWAVTKGQHVDVNYRSEGQLCGYLTGYSDFDFYLGEYRLAIGDVVEQYRLVLSSQVDDPGAAPEMKTALETRPILYTSDPAEETYKQQAWLMVAMILLCLCPCTGPMPLAGVLCFFCWARHDQYGGRMLVSPDEGDLAAVGLS